MTRFFSSSRGSALPETAVVVSFTLILLFGMLQIILIGYLQVAGDAAVFVAAHEYANYANPTAIATAEATAFPKEVANAVSFQPAPPPKVDAGPFNSMYGSNITGAAEDDRTGGFEMVRPQNFQAYLTQSGSNAALFKGVLGFKQVPLSSGAVEGFYLTSNGVMDTAGTGPNDTATLAGITAGNGSPFAPVSDGDATNMNVPPYYATTATMEFCSDPWQGNGFPADRCGAPQPWAFGLAEYLDNNNYASSMGVADGDVFQAMACHQRVYAELIQAFPARGGVDVSTFYNAFQNGKADTNAPAPWGTPGGDIYLADYDELFAYDAWRYNPPSWGASRILNGNKNVAGLDANNAEIGPAEWSTTPAIPGSDGASFGLVYQWDQPNVPIPGPGEAPLNPLLGCSAGEPGA